jgi:hypothetical protein
MSKPRRITELQLTTNPSISDLIALARAGSNSRVTIGTLLNSEFPTTLGNTTINGDLIVNGTETIISSSVLYDSGSTIFGNSTDDIHNFIGDVSITGSLFVSGTTELGGDIFPQTPQGATLGTSEKPFREIYLQSGSISIESDTPGDPSAFISNFNGNVDIKAAGFSVTSGSISPFIINNEGQITIQNAYQDPANEAILQIIGNNEGNIQTAVNPGSLIHVTGFDGITNRNVFDSYGGGGVFSQLILRNANGTAANPTSTAAGIIGRVATSGFITDVGFGIQGVTAPPASMNFYTPGYSSGSRETMIRFYATADNELDPNGYSAVIKAEGMEVTGSLDVSGSLTASLEEGYMWVGDSNNKNTPIPTGSFIQTSQTGSFVQSAYISCFSTSSISLATSGSEQVIDFTSIWTENGISLVDNNKFTFAEPGVYKLEFLTTIENSTNDELDSWFWIKLNGNNFPNSSTKVTVRKRKTNGQHTHQLVSISILGVAQTAGDYVQLYWTGEDTALGMPYEGATGVHPATPSVTLNIIRVG